MLNYASMLKVNAKHEHSLIDRWTDRQKSQENEKHLTEEILDQERLHENIDGKRNIRQNSPCKTQIPPY